MEQNKESTSEKTIGRNEPCPCRSGKKYKRCCGVDAAPKMTTPRALAPSGPAAPGGMTPDMLNQMDPAVMMKLSQSLQRLPKGQMQRLQSLVQRAMSGKDVSRESAEFEQTLPLEFQEMLRAVTAQAGALGSAPAAANEGGMSEEEARELVAKAAAEGKISQDEAEKLLGAESDPSSSRFGGLFKGLRKKK